MLKVLAREDLSAEETRKKFYKLMSFFPSSKDVEFTSTQVGTLSAVWAHAPGCTRKRVILYFHGGGYNSGSFPSHQDLIGRLAKATGCDVFAPSYRLAPENPFPAALEDAQAAYSYLTHQIAPQNIIFAGSSAGGGLLLALLIKLASSKEPLPLAAICICPWVDLALTGKTLDTNHGKDWIKKKAVQATADMYLQGHDPKDPLASPLYANLHGFPPLLIQAGSNEILLDEIQRLAKKAEESGVRVNLQIFDQMIHHWQLFSRVIPEGQQAIDQIGEYVKKIP